MTKLVKKKREDKEDKIPAPPVGFIPAPPAANSTASVTSALPPFKPDDNEQRRKQREDTLPAAPAGIPPVLPQASRPAPVPCVPPPEPDYEGELCALIERTLRPPKKEEDDIEWLNTLLMQKNIFLSSPPH